MPHLEIQIHDQMLSKRSAPSFLYVQENHDVMGVEIKSEVIVEDLVIRKAWLRHDVREWSARGFGIAERQGGFRDPLPG